MNPEIIHLPMEDGDDVYQCCDCGAYAHSSKAKIEHHNSCQPGEAKKWEEHYSKPEELPTVDEMMVMLKNSGLKPKLHSKAVKTKSYYIKFPEFNRLGSLRCSDHDGYPKYSYKWNLGTHITRTHKKVEETIDGNHVLRRYFMVEDLDWMIRIMQKMTGAKNDY